MTPISEPIIVTADEYQRRRVKFPTGNLHMPDGRRLRPAVGYDARRFAPDEATAKIVLKSAAWTHRDSGLVVSVAIDNAGRWGPLLRAAISYPDHDPTWAEIKAIQALFFPADMDAMMVMPRKADWVNLHQHCFHIWQLPQEWGIR